MIKLWLSNYDSHFIIKELTKESEGEFECLWENTEKYKTSFFQIEKELTKIDKDGNECAVNYILQNKIYWQCKIYGKFIIKSCW